MIEPPERPPRPAYRRWIEIALSVAALGATVLFVGARNLWTRLEALDGRWASIAVLIGLFQFVLLGARWWFVASRLGIPLSYRRALVEYYLSTFLNYVVPFGSFGDALRGFRHADRAAEPRPSERPGDAGKGRRPLGRAFLAIFIERASGQIALWIVVLAVAPDLWSAIS